MARKASQSWSHIFTLQVTVIVLIHSFLLSRVEGSSFKMRTKLMKHLLDSNCSSKRVRPVENDADTVNVTMDMTLSNVIDMDEVRQILTINMWVTEEWTNEIMIWKPEEWSGIQTISVDAADIWLPDTILYNNVFEEFDGRLDNVKTLVRVHYTGKTTWNAPFIFKTLCKIKVKNFPFDRQQCKLKFGSWRYAAKELNLWFARKTANLDERRIKNGEWDVINVDITRNALVYPCCPDDVYPDITFIINIRRRSLYYIFNLIIPNFLIALLAFFSFYIPVECGERISFVMTVLLSMFVFLLLVAESIPPTSEAVPAIGVFFTSSIVLVALALVATGLVLKINYLYLHVPGTNFSPALRRLLFMRLGPLLGFKECELFCAALKENKVQTSCVKHFLKKVDRNIPCSSTSDEAVKVVFQNSRKINGLSNQSDHDEADDCSVTFVMGETADTDVHHRGDSIAQDIHVIAAAVTSHQEDNTKSAECRLAAAIVDRFFMLLFILVFIVSTSIVLVIPYVSED